MNSFALAYIGGIVGAVLMDITETLAARAGLTSGVNMALVGRWALGLLRGQWAHADIALSTAQPGEVRMGWAFHLLVGGGGVALLYALLLHATGWTLPMQHVWGGVAFGAAKLFGVSLASSTTAPRPWPWRGRTPRRSPPAPPP